MSGRFVPVLLDIRVCSAEGERVHWAASGEVEKTVLR